MEATDLQTVIDQKNYIEEVNRIHTSNITNLQVTECLLAEKLVSKLLQYFILSFLFLAFWIRISHF